MGLVDGERAQIPGNAGRAPDPGGSGVSLTPTPSPPFLTPLLKQRSRQPVVRKEKRKRRYRASARGPSRPGGSGDLSAPPPRPRPRPEVLNDRAPPAPPPWAPGGRARSRPSADAGGSGWQHRGDSIRIFFPSGFCHGNADTTSRRRPSAAGD